MTRPGRPERARAYFTEVSATTGDLGGKSGQLTEADGGADVAEAIIVSEDGVLVVRRRVARLAGEEARLSGELGIFGDEHAAAGGGDDLVAVEGVDACEAEGPGTTVAIGGAQGLGRVLNQLHAVLGAASEDRGDVRRLSVEMHEDEGLGRPLR